MILLVLRLIPLLCLLLTVLLHDGAVCAKEAATKPNIIFIYADDLGFGDLACHGHPVIKTPNLDRMAREGTDFWSFTVVNPVCSPSRTGIVTGQFPSRWGVHQHFASHELNVQRGMSDWLDPQAPLLPRVLREAGYRTAHYGKWHLSGGGIVDAPLPAAYGYDDAAVWTGPGKHVFDGTDLSFARGEASPHDKDAASWISVAATNHAVEFIRQSRGQPFYLNLWLHETHHLVSATDQDKSVYPDILEPHRTYYAAVSRADRQVGRILDALDELKIGDHTIVIFSSDNGPENSHLRPGDKFYFSQGSTGGLRGRKRSLLMGGVNVPFLVRWPGVVPAGRVDKSTALAGVDVFLTLLAACDVAPPEGYVSDGENMLSAWKGQPTERTKPVFWWWQGKHTGDDWPALAMRDGPWVLILDELKQREELYDVIADRTQSRNQAAKFPDRVALVRKQLDAWQSSLPKAIDGRLQTKTVPSKATDPAAANPDRGAIFSRWDANGDEVLSWDEYRNGLRKHDDAERRFKNFDKDHSGTLHRDEFVNPSRD